MTIKKFLNIEIDDPPAELELSVELRCREIMASDDVDSVKRYCTHLVRHQMKQDVFLSSLLNRLIELEANIIARQMKIHRKVNRLKKFFHIP
tara:strand:- start:242 stop:517 length:276 start_codon:yes stop_codon:yes gene_type:complete